MNTLQIHHIGYLVKDIASAKADFIKLGYTIQKDTITDPIRKADICFLVKDGYLIELISPISPESVVAGLIKRYKNSPYHICYCTEDISSAANDLRQNGFTPIDEPTPAPALDNRKVMFLMGGNIGIIELLETKA